MVLYVANAQFGASGQGELQADEYFDVVLQHFAARPGLELDSEGAQQGESAWNAALLGDGGLQVGPYPLQGSGEGIPDYIQVSWDLQVEEIIAIDYED